MVERAETLAAKREVVVVLRLLVRQDGTIEHGHIVGPGQRTAGPYRDDQLGRALGDWISASPGPDSAGPAIGPPGAAAKVTRRA